MYLCVVGRCVWWVGVYLCVVGRCVWWIGVCLCDSIKILHFV